MTTACKKRPRDPVQLGKLIVEIATGQIADQEEPSGNDQAMSQLGRAGGIKGGKGRAESLSAERRRREIARQAALARYSKID